jgi:hypothetical protein
MENFMEKFNPFIRHDVATVCHLQVVFLSAECGLPYAEIAEITGYAVSTVRNYVRKYADDIDLARAFFEQMVAEVVEVEEEPTPNVLYRKFRDGRSVPMVLMPGYGENLSNEQMVYFFKFYGADELLFDKIGTTTKNAVSRLRDEIGEYSKKFPIDKVEIHRIRSCNGIPAEGYESQLRAKLIADHPTAFRKNDRFFGADIDPAVFDEICDQFYAICGA